MSNNFMRQFNAAQQRWDNMAPPDEEDYPPEKEEGDDGCEDYEE